MTPPRFTLRQLSYFAATGEAGSIRLASERIHVSQPSISNAISQLEQEFGISLFIRRHAQGLHLTPAGRQLLREVKVLLSQAEGLYTIAGEISDEVKGPLTVGCMLTLAPLLLPKLCYSFGAENPAVRIRSSAKHHKDLMEGLQNAAIDIAISYDLGIPEDVRFETLGAVPPRVLLPAGHRLAGEGAVSLEDLEEEPFILLDLPHSREYFISLFVTAGIKPKIAHESEHPELIRTMVGNGLGYSLVNIVADAQYSMDGHELVTLELAGKHRPMMIGMASPDIAGPSRVVAAFEQYCRDRVPQMSMIEPPSL